MPGGRAQPHCNRSLARETRACHPASGIIRGDGEVVRSLSPAANAVDYHGPGMRRVAWLLPGALVLGGVLGVPLAPWSSEGTSADISPPPTRIGAPAPPKRDTSDSQNGPQAQTPIEHFVILMQENHTFDNYFGTYPGADGIPPGVCMPVNPQDTGDARCVTPFHLEPGARQLDDSGTSEGHVAPVDPDHSQSTFQAQYNNGRLDGFVYALNLRNQDGRIAMGYYDARDLPYYWAIADQYVLFDRFFSSASGGSVINHFFWIAGASGGNQDRFARAGANDLPTIFDRLEQHGISWKFYIQNFDANLTYRNAHLYPGNRASQVTWAPVLAMDRFIDDPRLFSHLADLDQYYVDLQNETLPAVAYLVPSGTSEHPPGRIQSGQRFVVSLINALIRSSAWKSSAFMWAYDDWGGWYDHVPPPQVDAYGYGFRVPALLVSPYARRGHVDHTVLDFASILRFIEDNWRLGPLGERDTFATSIENAFDFSGGPRAPRFLSPDRSPAVQTPSVRGLVYAMYGGGAACAGLLVLGATSRPRQAPWWPGRPAWRWGPRVAVRLLSGTLIGLAALSASFVLMRTGSPPSAETPLVAPPTAMPIPVPTLGPVVVPTLVPVVVPTPDVILEERFVGHPPGWPNDRSLTAWFDVDGYHLFAREPSRFVALSAPGSNSLGDVVVRATFRKAGGPPGGGYGVIIRDQSAHSQDGVNQGGRYYVAEAGDRGEVGIWRRANDRWVDLVPWTPSAAVRTSRASNDLELRAVGAHLSLIVNGVPSAAAEDVVLGSGSVGVFVGGDFNEVILDRFEVEPASS